MFAWRKLAIILVFLIVLYFMFSWIASLPITQRLERYIADTQSPEVVEDVEPLRQDLGPMELPQLESLNPAKDVVVEPASSSGGGGGDSGGGGGGSGSSEPTLCERASDAGLCDGLDITYGDGTKSNCCTDDGVCC